MQLLKAIKQGLNRLHIQQGEKKKNDDIWNRISDFDKQRISQPKIQ